jgi:hypothetical protein
LSGHSRSRKVSTSSRSNTSRLPIRFAGIPRAHLAFGHVSSTARDSTEWNLLRVALRELVVHVLRVPAAVGEDAARVLVDSAGRLSDSVEAHERADASISNPRRGRDFVRASTTELSAQRSTYTSIGRGCPGIRPTGRTSSTQRSRRQTRSCASPRTVRVLAPSRVRRATTQGAPVDERPLRSTRRRSLAQLLRPSLSESARHASDLA